MNENELEDVEKSVRRRTDECVSDDDVDDDGNDQHCWHITPTKAMWLTTCLKDNAFDNTNLAERKIKEIY
ncbi:unnamed protein product [Ceratitis capitata]|uniref:(Mediterranean fruit fly) hypothetical protein n=1 Tax=Ceratitis capitata TaxID=7213 RepID=A0A811UXB6_CERCA|nr:unnamed protein product [Ceratitis capitata]